MSSTDRALRDQLVEFLRGGAAHADLSTVLDDFPIQIAGRKPEGAPFTAWQLLEHIRFSLNDLLIFSTDPKYVTPKWPDEYWPKEDAPVSDEAWKESLEALKADTAAFEELIQNPESNLYAKIPWGDGQTLLHEALLAVDHTSYHLGQIVALRKQLDAWK